jgi:phosphate:Na+ symporter
MGKRTLEMFNMIPQILAEKRQKDYNMLLERVEKYENIIDNMEVEIAIFLTKISEGKLSDQSSAYIKSMMRIIDDLESIGDVCYKLTKVIDLKNKKNQYFIQELRDNWNALYKLTRAAMESMNQQLSMQYTESDISESSKLDSAIHDLREKLRQEHVVSIKEEKYSYQTGIIYNDIIRLTERIGDYAFRVSESVNEVKESKN